MAEHCLEEGGGPWSEGEAGCTGSGPGLPGALSGARRRGEAHGAWHVPSRSAPAVRAGKKGPIRAARQRGAACVATTGRWICWLTLRVHLPVTQRTPPHLRVVNHASPRRGTHARHRPSECQWRPSRRRPPRLLRALGRRQDSPAAQRTLRESMGRVDCRRGCTGRRTLGFGCRQACRRPCDRACPLRLR